MSSIRRYVFAGVVSLAAAHMGISSPQPVDLAVGDAYRYPVNNGGMGACHGRGAGAKYTWVWTPSSSGQCEIYQNCFKDLPVSGQLKMSGGAAHDGGLCNLYECTGAITVPPCERNFLPEMFGTCTKVAADNDCTNKGSFSYSSLAGAGGQVPDLSVTLPPISFPPGGTATKIRCGTSWTDANSKCGSPCVDDSGCVAGEACYADLNDCPSGGGNEPVSRPEAPKGTNFGPTCVSKQAHITDAWCQTVGCAEVYSAYCGAATAAGSYQAAGLSVICRLYVTIPGETFTDVALRWDVDVEKLKELNPDVQTDTTGIIPTNTVLELPGDCETAKTQAVNASGASQSTFFGALLVAVGLGFCL